MPAGPIPVDELRRRRRVDVEQLLTDWTTAAFAGLRLKVSTELPPGDQLAAALADYPDGYVQVEAFGGPGAVDPTQESVNVDVDAYVAGDADGNPNRAGAADLAELLRVAYMEYLPGYTTDDGHATVTEVTEFARPTARPYDADPNLRRFSAAYQFTVQSRG